MIGPGVGLDAAAIALDDTILVIKSDPITFPTPDAARYLVNVNANDIACLGAIPRWLLVTSLLPEGATTVGLVEQQFESLTKACQALGIDLIGGHSEITIGIDRPILCGTLLGETDAEGLLDIRDAKPGDSIVLCNGIAIEGTTILASEAPAKLLSEVESEIIETARNFSSTPGISVVSTTRTLLDRGVRPRGLHDPTEGGLASALDEVATATGCGLIIEAQEIDILPETQAICNALGLNPLGLIASGALLAVFSPSDVNDAMRAFTADGVRASIIGRLTDDPAERILVERDRTTTLPHFEADEIARFFSSIQE